MILDTLYLFMIVSVFFFTFSWIETASAKKRSFIVYYNMHGTLQYYTLFLTYRSRQDRQFTPIHVSPNAKHGQFIKDFNSPVPIHTALTINLHLSVRKSHLLI